MIYGVKETFGKDKYGSCMLEPGIRNCGHKCNHCGFRKPENARRMRLLEDNGLTKNPETGLKYMRLVFNDEE